VLLTFDGYDEKVKIAPKASVDKMLGSIKTYDTRSRAEFAAGNYDYFRANDDFAGLARDSKPKSALVSLPARAAVFAAATVLCATALLGSIIFNQRVSDAKWFRHSVSGASAAPSQKRPVHVPPPSPQLVAQPLPENARLRSFTDLDRIAPFEIEADQWHNYLLKLVDAHGGTPVLTVFVRKGMTATIDVPLGTYEVRLAAGESWFGDEYLFGPDTAYSKADKQFAFDVINNDIRGFTLTLSLVTNGNLRTSTIKPEEF
jgi:hypothetical protein